MPTKLKFDVDSCLLKKESVDVMRKSHCASPEARFKSSRLERHCFKNWTTLVGQTLPSQQLKTRRAFAWSTVHHHVAQIRVHQTTNPPTASPPPATEGTHRRSQSTTWTIVHKFHFFNVHHLQPLHNPSYRGGDDLIYVLCQTKWSRITVNCVSSVGGQCEGTPTCCCGGGNDHPRGPQ